MKKIIITLVCVFIIVFFILFIDKGMNNKDLKVIKVAEVTHSAFYAPFYVAIENNYFKEKGYEIELLLTPGADKVSAAVLSNDVEIGFCGPESSIYVYNGGEKDYIVNFAGLTKRDGQFIVSRTKEDNFKLHDLVDKEILVGRIGGMPALNFEKALINESVTSAAININYSIEFAALTGAFIGGTGDYVNLFEPNATKIEKEGYGFVVASVGSYSDEVPYTAFNARKSFILDNKKLITDFTKAINRGLKFVQENEPQIIAEVISKQFPDMSLNDLTTIINRYKEADSWLISPYISEESFNNLQEIMLLDNQINEMVPYEKLINNYYE